MNITIRNQDNTLRETFWTDATPEDVLWSIKIHTNREDMIRLWDREKILSNIGWVSYHLRRAGFEVSEKRMKVQTFVKIVDEIEIYSEKV